MARRRPRRVIAGDSIDDSYTKYSDLGWQVVSDEQSYASLHNQTKHDAIAHRIVYKPAEDATSKGFRILIPSNPGKQAQYQKKLDDLAINSALCQQVVDQREDGDGYLTIGVQEKQATSTDMPLVPTNIDDVVFLHAFGQSHVDKVQTNDDPTSVDYGKEQAIVIRPEQSGYTIDKNGNEVPNLPQLAPVTVDHTRYWRISLDRSEDDDTGTSILTRCADQLKAMNIALTSVGKMLREFTFKFFKSDNLMSEGNDQFQKDKAEIGRILNTESTVFGHNEDSIEKVATPTSGIDVLLNFVWQQLSSACGIPKSVLTGEQAGTLAGASQDVINYYDSVRSIQNNLLKPEIEQIVRLLMYADNVAGGFDDPDQLDWKITFKPLESLDDKTQSEIFLNDAQAYGSLIQNTVIAPDEAKQMLQGENNNGVASMETTTDSDDTITDDDIKNYKHDLKTFLAKQKKARHGET